MRIPFWPKILAQQYRTHQNADLYFDDYFKIYNDKFKNVKIGSSFAPELLDQIYQLEYHAKIDHKHKLEILKIMAEQLWICNIRLGIRWNKSVDHSGKFDFSYYQPYVDYCLKNKISVCLNIGPIKTFGWPEEHIPDVVLKKLPSDFYLHPVTPESKLGIYALKFLAELLQFLKTTYTEKQLNQMHIFQPENESFNRFGTYKLRLTDTYLKTVIQQIYDDFPDKFLLLNSAQTWQTDTIARFFSQLQRDSIFNKKLICGINYYYNLPRMPHLGKIGPLDVLTLVQMIGFKTAEQNIRMSREIGYDIEVTEAQFEQWGNSILSPGNSSHEFKYLLGRCVDNLLDINKGGVIRLWGLERLAQKIHASDLTYEHKEIIRVITKINSKVGNST